MSATSGNSPPALALVRRLTTLHHALRVDGDRLLIAPPPPPELVPFIKEHKAAILEVLAGQGGRAEADPFQEQYPPVGWAWSGPWLVETGTAGGDDPGDGGGGT